MARSWAECEWPGCARSVRKYGYAHQSHPFAIFGLARFRELISGLQSLRGKILSRSELAGRNAAFAWAYAAVLELFCALLTSCSEIAAPTRNSSQITSDKGLRYVHHLAMFTVSASTMMKRFFARGKVRRHSGAVEIP